MAIKFSEALMYWLTARSTDAELQTISGVKDKNCMGLL